MLPLAEHRSLGAALPVIGLMLAGLILAGCSTTPSSRGPDGPPLAGSETPDLQQLADAEPRLESIRSGGPNKPYEVLGQSYVPMTGDGPLVERGLASWYGRKFHGRRTASGETYNMYAMTAAHKTMPIPSYARVRNPATGREVVVRVNDRGPFSAGRVIDLSYAAAVKLGVQNGVTPVEVERITYEDIRAGLANRGPNNLARAPALPPVPAPVPVPVPMPAPAMPPVVTVADAPIPAPVSVADAITLVAASPAVAEPTERARSYTSAASGFWLQLGAFGRGDGAYSFQQRVAAELDWLSPLLTVFAEGGLHRLQAGPYASRDQAREAAERIRAALALVPVIVERR
ncbi:MAG TPA: septal ring lytic transglycosylase RlpA family protein [Ideonella sp.]|nr:septal ring lytic transglycosylase RlpA family protein [Ideonella sp.]